MHQVLRTDWTQNLEHTAGPARTLIRRRRTTMQKTRTLGHQMQHAIVRETEQDRDQVSWYHITISYACVRA